MYSTVVSGRIFECISGVLRLSGAASDKRSELETEDDSRLLLAKQYIKDNVTTSLTAADVALYCGMSAKQMFRIFMSGEGLSPAEYVRRKRCKYVEKLLADTTLSLREISEIMNFNNEYYFNAYFKKYSGMTPGAYRRSLSK